MIAWRRGLLSALGSFRAPAWLFQIGSVHPVSLKLLPAVEHVIDVVHHEPLRVRARDVVTLFEVVTKHRLALVEQPAPGGQGVTFSYVPLTDGMADALVDEPYYD